MGRSHRPQTPQSLILSNMRPLTYEPAGMLAFGMGLGHVAHVEAREACVESYVDAFNSYRVGASSTPQGLSSWTR